MRAYPGLVSLLRDALCLVDRTTISFSTSRPPRNQFDMPGMNHCRCNARVLAVLVWSPILFHDGFLSFVAVRARSQFSAERHSVDSQRWRLMSLIRRSIMRMWLFVEYFRSPYLSCSLLLSFSLLSTLLLVLVLSLSASLFLAIRRRCCCRFSFSPSSSLYTADYARLSFSLVGDSPGPEVVMSASVARAVASRRIVTNDDVTLEISRPVIQVVSLCTAWLREGTRFTRGIKKKEYVIAASRNCESARSDRALSLHRSHLIIIFFPFFLPAIASFQFFVFG